MLITLSVGANPHVEAPPAVANAVVAPLNPLNTITHWLKSATPSEFLGDHVKGHAFLNWCDLYIGLAPTQFTNDQAEIYWVLSFIKGNCTVHFMDQTMWLAQQMGLLPWATWAEFRLEFIHDFCLKNEVQMAHTDLEMSKYHQGSHSIDEYISEFCKLVDHTKYTEGVKIVLKFQHGLNPIIQNYISCLTYSWSSDNVPNDWYDAAILCNENHIANSAFQSSTWTTTITGDGAHHNPVTGVTKPMDSMPAWVMAVAPSIRITLRLTQDSNAIDVDVTHRWGPNPTVCYQCGKTGHSRPNCSEVFDVYTMTMKECSDFVQHELAALDICTTDIHQLEEVEGIGQEESTAESGFMSCNKWIVCPYYIPWIVLHLCL